MRATLFALGRSVATGCTASGAIRSDDEDKPVYLEYSISFTPTHLDTIRVCLSATVPHVPRQHSLHRHELPLPRGRRLDSFHFELLECNSSRCGSSISCMMQAFEAGWEGRRVGSVDSMSSLSPECYFCRKGVL